MEIYYMCENYDGDWECGFDGEVEARMQDIYRPGARGMTVSVEGFVECPECGFTEEVDLSE